MDIEKLIHCLQCCSRVDAHNTGCEACDLEYCEPECQQLCETAAAALSTLRAENERLLKELEYEQEHANAYHEECGQWEAENTKLRAECDMHHSAADNYYAEAQEYRQERNDAMEELEAVRAERDAAVEDVAAIIGDIEAIRQGYGVDNADADDAFANLCGTYCVNNSRLCYKEGDNYRCEHFKWRGPEKGEDTQC